MTLNAFERKVRFFFWVIRGFIIRHFLKFVVLVSLTLGVLFFFTKIVNLGQLAVPSYTQAVIGHYKINELPYQVLTNLSRGLTKVDKDGRVIGDLADNWQIDSGGKIFTFNLKKGLVWNDFTPINSSDLNIAFEQVKITYPDQTKIKFELADAFAPLPSLLSKPVFKKQTTIGTGVYRLEKMSSDKDDNVEKLNLLPLKGNLPNLNFKFYPNKETAILALKLGEVDGIADCPCPNIFSDWPNIKTLETSDYSKFVAIFFNTQDNLLSSKDIRQGLAYGIKKDWFPGERALGPIAKNSLFYNQNLKNYEYNPEKAKELLKDIGKERRNLTLKTLPAFKEIAQKIALDWQQLDFNVKVETNETLSGDFQILLAGQEFSTDPDQYTLWHSTQEKTNITKLKNPKIDKLLEDGRKTTDESKRKEIYLDFQKTLVDEAPAIFLYHPDTFYFVNKKSENNVKRINSVVENFWPS